MSSPIAPQHPLTKRLVTTHGDLHCQNCLDLGPEQALQCIDFEFTCAAGAYLDLGAAMGQIGWNRSKRGIDHRRAFLAAYCEGIGHPLEGAELDDLLLDVAIAGELAHFHATGLLAPWTLKDEPRDAIVEKLDAYARIAGEARGGDVRLRDKVIAEGLNEAVKEHPIMVQLLKDQLRRSETYQRLQAGLDAAIGGDMSVAAPAIEGPFEVVTISAAHDPTKAIQVKPGTDLLQLAQAAPGAEPSIHQQWRLQGEVLQHVATGMFLDAPVEYLFHHRGRPWEAGGELRVRPREEEDVDRQRWVIDGELIRHRMDGRALDVNFWEIEEGRGVNLNVPRTTADGCSWLLKRLDGEILTPPGVQLEVITLDEADLGEASEQKPAERNWEWYSALAKERGSRLPTVFELRRLSVCRGSGGQNATPDRHGA